MPTRWGGRCIITNCPLRQRLSSHPHPGQYFPFWLPSHRPVSPHMSVGVPLRAPSPSTLRSACPHDEKTSRFLLRIFALAPAESRLENVIQTRRTTALLARGGSEHGLSAVADPRQDHTCPTAPGVQNEEEKEQVGALTRRHPGQHESKRKKKGRGTQKHGTAKSKRANSGSRRTQLAHTGTWQRHLRSCCTPERSRKRRRRCSAAVCHDFPVHRVHSWSSKGNGG